MGSVHRVMPSLDGVSGKLFPKSFEARAFFIHSPRFETSDINSCKVTRVEKLGRRVRSE